MKLIKKILFLTILACVSITMIVYGSTFLNALVVNYTVLLNNVKINFKNPIATIDETTYVPLREFCESQNWSVEWKGEEKIINIDTNNNQNEVSKFLSLVQLPVEYDSVNYFGYQNDEENDITKTDLIITVNNANIDKMLEGSHAIDFTQYSADYQKQIREKCEQYGIETKDLLAFETIHTLKIKSYNTEQGRPFPIIQLVFKEKAQTKILITTKIPQSGYFY